MGMGRLPGTMSQKQDIEKGAPEIERGLEFNYEEQ
jgi:hypothetical protein